MTTQEMIDEVRTSLGNRTDITEARYVLWLNWALLDICGMHRKRVFTPKRFQELEDITLINLSPLEGDTGPNSTDVLVDLGVGSSPVANIHRNRVIQIGGEARFIVSYTQPFVTLSEPLPAAPPIDTTYQIFRKVASLSTDFILDPKDVVYAVERLETLEGTPLSFVPWTNLTSESYLNLGIPQRFARHGGNVIFSPTPSGGYIRAYIYRYPRLLDASTPLERTNLQQLWDETIVLGAIARGFQKLMEPDRSREAMDTYIYDVTNKMNSFQAEEYFWDRRGFKVV